MKPLDLSHAREAHSRVINSIDLQDVWTLGHELIQMLTVGTRLFICGCGGSAADAQHFAAELVGSFNAKDRERARYPLSVTALTADTIALTAIANDYGFQTVFARQLRAHAHAGDVLIVLSTSGTTEAIHHVVAAAKDVDVSTICLTGQLGSMLAEKCDMSVVVHSTNTARIQEAHGFILHLLAEMIVTSEMEIDP